ADDTGADEVDAELLKLRSEEMVLLSNFGPEHPKVRAVRMQIEFLRTNQAPSSLLNDVEAREALQAYAGRLERELVDLAKSEESLSELFNEEQAAAKDL